MAATDGSGVSLGTKIERFVEFIAKRCQPSERSAYLDALAQIQPGARGERSLDADDMAVAGAELQPNIRLANGEVRSETRQRLMLSFNTPFFPEVLVASSVLAKGWTYISIAAT